MTLDSLLLSAARLSLALKSMEAPKEAALNLATPVEYKRETKVYSPEDLAPQTSKSVRVNIPKGFDRSAFTGDNIPLFKDYAAAYDNIAAICYGLEAAKKANADLILVEMASRGLDHYQEPRFGISATIVSRTAKRPVEGAKPIAVDTTTLSKRVYHTPLADAIAAASGEE